MYSQSGDGSHARLYESAGNDNFMFFSLGVILDAPSYEFRAEGYDQYSAYRYQGAQADKGGGYDQINDTRDDKSNYSVGTSPSISLTPVLQHWEIP